MSFGGMKMQTNKYNEIISSKFGLCIRLARKVFNAKTKYVGKEHRTLTTQINMLFQKHGKKSYGVHFATKLSYHSIFS